MENKSHVVYLTENELNFQLIQLAEQYGLADEVTSSLNKEFIKQYTTLKQIPVDLAKVIMARFEAILDDARTKWQEYAKTINQLSG